MFICGRKGMKGTPPSPFSSICSSLSWGFKERIFPLPSREGLAKEGI